ncbi:MAG: hypothetical protein EOQ55_24100 [Mesorhizobium sp.]|uniref:glucosamine inositolphosphorylceramide transferase family protein n=1 Tax=unclassified Mesorhizobium TaxID=325217 RepID=UPI000BAFB075|nr:MULTISPECIES: hypothetical protein [unclassified Mesorhizobium]PBB36144.1 hypothetical protein CK214_01380 [Mesorhizobium sp. WSM3882]RUV06582.1 hypothetical protein EOA79_08200 [Mesorhizobium sp. M1A.F.Ca.IN.020.03.2.1]RUV46116.1 hypothetical protein EOD29_04670 [Mesorhizobium sp. M1A.T.Ca.IN.004.03.1.1]RUV86478.1 hypothetical protein EOA51_14645 [Mesorhizobium sp. M1A.F.Ca.IN.020.32.1.1]RUW14069.1 hypothetical protein EOA46_04590 [Mesorhizobium sp. M1A.F.Ca.IN.022.05.2.1]
MLAIEVIVPQSAPRHWQQLAIERLEADGHDVAVAHQPGPSTWPAAAKAAFQFEQRLFRRRGPLLGSALQAIPARPGGRPAALRLDLAGDAALSNVPTIGLRFDGSSADLSAAIAVAAGRLPVIEAVLDRKTVVGQARPMVDKRESTALGTEDVFARAITLVQSVTRAFAADRLPREAVAEIHGRGERGGFTSAYLGAALPRLGREALRRARFRHAHWRVGYRFTDALGVADTGKLGTGWSVLPDPGDHFYADPFPFWWQGQPFVFVEDYPHATGKAVISVVPFDADGVPGEPRVVLEEAHHLSYPQVFERDGAIWMLPEASAGGKLTLYRASGFPDSWLAETVLVEGEISDATLFEHEGMLWLFATDRDGHGSTSDTLVIFSAPALAGPWRPHPANPILIDHRMARPGGAFVRNRDGRVLLPVQDGTLGYGGGLGLSKLLELNQQTVRLSPPRPIDAAGDFPYPKIHTLNRAGRLEVIDGIAAVRKRSGKQ